MGLTAVSLKFRDSSSCIAVSGHKVLLAQLTHLEEWEGKIPCQPCQQNLWYRHGEDSVFLQGGSTTLDENTPPAHIPCSRLGNPASRITPAQLARNCPITAKPPDRKGYAQLDGTHTENVVKLQLQSISIWPQ